MSLARATGIPYESLRRLVQWGRTDPHGGALANVAARLGFTVKFVGRRGCILRAVDLRTSQDRDRRLLLVSRA